MSAITPAYHPVFLTAHEAPHGIMLATATDHEGATYAASENTADALGAASYVRMSGNDDAERAHTSTISAEHAIGLALASRGGWTWCDTCDTGHPHAHSGLMWAEESYEHGYVQCRACHGYGIVGVIR